MKKGGLLFISIFTLSVIASGCAHRAERPVTTSLAITGKLLSIKASAIVELTRDSTEKGRAIILASSPDSFRIEIKGPLGTTGALITGNKRGLTIFRKGEFRSFEPDDARIPFNIKAAELVSLLLGKENLTTGTDATFEIQDIPGGKSITKSRNGVILYRAALTGYQEVGGFFIPFTISIYGDEYKLLVKYVRVNINPEIKENLFKIKR